MLEINNGDRTYGFLYRHINYIYLKRMTITVVTITGNTININFESPTVLRAQINNIVIKLWRQLATIPGVIGGIGVIFWINCCNVYSHQVNSENISVNYNLGNALTISCINSHEATNHNNHLENRYIAANLENYISGKTKSYVNSSYTLNQIQTAINNSNSGDVVIFEAGTYTNKYFDLKDGVDIILSDAVFEMTTALGRAVIMDGSVGENIVNCKIFGSAVFNFGASTGASGGSVTWLYPNGNPNYNTSWLIIDQLYNSNIYLEFKSAECSKTAISSFIHQWDDGELRVDGLSLYSLNTRSFDAEASGSPTEGMLFDNGILFHIMEDGGSQYVPFNAATDEYYFRNNYFETIGNDMSHVSQLFIQNDTVPNINFVNARFKKNNANGAVIEIASDTFEEFSAIRMWQSEFDVDEGSVMFGGFIPGQNIELYGTIYSNTASEMNETGTGEYIEDAGFGLSRPTITDALYLMQPSDITVEDNAEDRTVTIDEAANSSYYEVYRDDTRISGSEYTEIHDIKIYDVDYKYRAVSITGFKTIFTKLFNIQIMPLSNMPAKSKYTIGDEVYYSNLGVITPLEINAVFVEVSNPNNDASGVQTNTYGFVDQSFVLDESKLFASKNSLLKNIKGEYFNSDLTGDPVLLLIADSGFDGQFLDYGGLYLTNNDLNLASASFGDAIFDDTDLTDCTLPDDVDTKAEFKAAVKSYDKVTTIWTDGNAIG